MVILLGFYDKNLQPQDQLNVCVRAGIPNIGGGFARLPRTDLNAILTSASWLPTIEMHALCDPRTSSGIYRVRHDGESVHSRLPNSRKKRHNLSRIEETTQILLVMEWVIAIQFSGSGRIAFLSAARRQEIVGAAPPLEFVECMQ